MFFYKVALSVFGLLLSLSSLSARCNGKIDLAPVILNVDTLESGKKIRGQDLKGARLNIDYLVYKNFLARGTALIAFGDAALQSYQIAAGVCLPYKKFNFTPLLGLSYTRWKTDLDRPELRVESLEEKFWSFGPFLGIEATWDFCDKWRVGGSIQYIWSKTFSQLRPFFRDKSNSKGPSYSAMIEYDLDNTWSINFGGAYNSSLTHEKHGIRGKGIKVGLVYWIPGPCDAQN